MANDDDIERLLREVDALESGRPQPPAKRSSAVERQPDAQSKKRSPRTSWTVVSAVGGGASGFLTGSLLVFVPWVDPMSTGIGAAIGGALIGLIGGPPGWFGKSD